VKNKESNLKDFLFCPVICVGNIFKEKTYDDAVALLSKSFQLNNLTLKQFDIVTKKAL
jgi:hypothetical protein